MCVDAPGWPRWGAARELGSSLRRVEQPLILQQAEQVEKLCCSTRHQVSSYSGELRSSSSYSCVTLSRELRRYNGATTTRAESEMDAKMRTKLNPQRRRTIRPYCMALPVLIHVSFSLVSTPYSTLIYQLHRRESRDPKKVHHVERGTRHARTLCEELFSQMSTTALLPVRLYTNRKVKYKVGAA